MSASPPRRLVVLAAPGSVLADGLTAARLRGPSEDDLRALERDLAATLGGAALLGAAGAAMAKAGNVAAGASHAWLSMAAVKVTAVAVLAAAGTTGAVAWRRHDTPRERTVAVAPRPDSPPARPLPAIATARTPTATEAAAPPASSPLPAPSPAPRIAETAPWLGRSEAVRSRRRDTSGAVGIARPLTTNGAAGDGADLRGELNLIARAQQALADDPTGALALAEEHERRYGAPRLVQEREVVAVAALAKLGRLVEARARAERFIRRFPESAHAARMRRLAAPAAGTP